ncbi:VOC family protein [Diaphorobacter sp. HDW4A]|uniref:VOC family protein n=1 Tax=Diaphorobacter sp. HDW4A TaxID=2714924 RepID=UPI00140E80CB|nr:VOC family protein [Diaphorobacter sp. HDW4A]QIL82552.1 VOC family protein [Diaphorobacter sp. HDW4A]
MSANSNPVVWFEIYVQDMARARKFYETVLQKTLAPMQAPEGDASGFEMVSFAGDPHSPGAGGMLVKMDGVPSGGGGVGTLVYFACDDCAVEQSRVEAAGGKIHKPKFSIGPYGFCALMLDTEGNCFGLHSMT